ncbi:hypothetical protein NE237_025234 [Protea cynaroides]|uniref:Transposase MuDR plant domain-containing protein n=1 Tax=Protea cynaroides TaxID=273540 RepID=A0A9Q0H204_9MAGN|nr:hypothetical protein NE237_025234 [Protea cynaroides]
MSITYHYGDYTEVKNADPECYNYVDVVYDAYCSVLKDIPNGRIIKFNVKATLPNGDESVLKEDKDVVRMFEKSADACDPIHCSVFGLEVNEEVSNVYWIDTFGEWQQHGGGSDNQNHSESEGFQSDGEEDEVSDGGQSGGCMLGNEGDEDQLILKCVDSNKDIDDSNILKMEKGLLFDDVNAYKKYLRDYAIQEGVQILYLKNEKSRVTVACCERGCTWRIHASHTLDRTTYCVKSFNPKHSCGRVDKNKATSATWIASQFANRLKVDPHMS